MGPPACWCRQAPIQQALGMMSSSCDSNPLLPVLRLEMETPGGKGSAFHFHVPAMPAVTPTRGSWFRAAPVSPMLTAHIYREKREASTEIVCSESLQLTVWVKRLQRQIVGSPPASIRCSPAWLPRDLLESPPELVKEAVGSENAQE